MSDEIQNEKPEVATLKDTLFVTSQGVKIKYRGLSPFKLQLVRDQVPMPKVPTYTIKTATGKEETFKLDEEAAETVELGKQIWKRYLDEVKEASARQNEESTKSILRLSCNIVDWGTVGNDWETDYSDFGVEVPIKQRDREVFYMQYELSGDEIQKLLNLIVSESGATEQQIKDAEGSFRN